MLTGMKVHHLNAGTLCPPSAWLVNGRGGLFSPARMVCHVLLLETAGGLTLVDGGIGLGDVADPDRLGRCWVRETRPRLDRAETVFELVRARGFDPRDVRRIVMTHLDLDHAGCVPDFPNATVHVHARELAAARAYVPRAGRWRYVPAQMPPAERARTYPDGGETWKGFAGVRMLDEREPDVLLVPLHGHTAGHCGVAVRQGERWLLHAGDAFFFHGQMQARPHAPLVLTYFQRRADVDRAQRVANQARLHALAQTDPSVTVFCAHDPVDFDRAATLERSGPHALTV
jgi:glyoxylase-like metal-dependent hydrolase (beta-lactamase superfamily II)